MDKITALQKYLELSPDEFSEVNEGHDENTFSYGNQEYLVLTDSEADEKAAYAINELLWAFNPVFLSCETNIDASVFKAIQANNKCESNNPAILSIIVGTCGIDSFIASAISADGRGHFLAGYDYEENEEGDFFIYRTN